MEIFKNGEIEISYYTKGSGPDVLFLHGFPDTSALWSEQADALSKDFRVIVPDLRGFGASSKPTNIEAYRINETAGDMFGLLDHLNVKKANVVGHDWGAFLAWYLVSSKPERCLKVAVLSCGNALSFFIAGGLVQRQKSWYMLFFQDPKAEEWLTANDWALWKVLMGDTDPKITNQHIKQMSIEGNLTAGLNWYRANCSPGQFATTTIPKVPKIKVPILALWSTNDKFLVEEQITASEQFVEDGLFSYKRIEGAGHWLQRDAPEAVNKALIDFFG